MIAERIVDGRDVDVGFISRDDGDNVNDVDFMMVHQ
jgi:hypothetical protein